MSELRPEPRVFAVARDGTHRFSKVPAGTISLLAGLGVEGDAHCGVTVKHRSRVARDPTQPNLRQVHFIHAELFEELAAKGFAVAGRRDRTQRDVRVEIVIDVQRRAVGFDVVVVA